MSEQFLILSYSISDRFFLPFRRKFWAKKKQHNSSFGRHRPFVRSYGFNFWFSLVVMFFFFHFSKNSHSKPRCSYFRNRLVLDFVHLCSNEADF